MNRSIGELSEKIKKIEDKIRDQVIKIPIKIAVFDLDNTLIIHDIGEAVFARLKQAEGSGLLTVDRKPLPLSWSQYQDLIEQGKKEEAYKKMVKAMAGLPLHTLFDITRKIIRTRARTIRIEGHSVPVPRVNRTMHALIRLLKKLQYRIYIISSSNHYSVRVIAETMLGIPGSCAFGIQSKMVDWPTAGHRNHFQVLTANLGEPVPVSRGKAAVYKKYIDLEG